MKLERLLEFIIYKELYYLLDKKEALINEEELLKYLLIQKISSLLKENRITSDIRHDLPD